MTRLDDLVRVAADEAATLDEDAEIVASVSGGKDSAAMALLLRELGLPHRRVFMDTGWEAAQTYEYLDYLRERLGPIEVLTPPRKMEDLIRHKGMFPSRVRRFCTQELKVYPMIRYLDALEADTVNVVGVRAAESLARARLPPLEAHVDFGTVWRPLLWWTEEDVVEMHRRHDLRPNPLYLAGASRVGCWPCIYARKAEIRLVADIDPGRIDRLRVLEEQVGEAAATRARAKGEPERTGPAWFQARTGGGGECWPIDQVVEWSRTSRGGRQFELFGADMSAEGCMRWGMCEHEDESAKEDA